jgi:outer membrane protein assembly factor BamB
MFRFVRGFAAIAVCAASAGAAHAQLQPDWATHNGNERHTGYVPMTLNPANFKVRWSVTLPGGLSGYNPAATGGGAAYISDKAWFSVGHFFALDLATGNLLWSHEYTSATYGGIPIMNAPAYRKGMAYVSTGGHEDAALWGYDATTGAQAFRAPIAAQWETYFAPTPYGAALYMNGGAYGGAYSFRATSGNQVWFATLPQYAEWTPAVDDQYVYAYTTQLDLINRRTGHVDKTIPDPRFNWGGYSVGCAPVLGSRGNVLVTQGGRLVNFDLALGNSSWEAPVTTGYYGEFSQPSLADGQVYYGKAALVQVFDEGTGHVLQSWSVPNGANIESTIILTKNLFFVSTSGGTYAVNRQTAKVAWRTPEHGNLSLSSDGVLVIVGADGKVTAVQTHRS